MAGENCVYSCSHPVYGGVGTCVSYGDGSVSAPLLSYCDCTPGYLTTNILGYPSCVNAGAHYAVHAFILLLSVACIAHGCWHFLRQRDLVSQAGAAVTCHQRVPMMDALRFRLAALEAAWGVVTAAYFAAEMVPGVRFAALFPAFALVQVLFVTSSITAAHLWVCALPRALLRRGSMAALLAENCATDASNRELGAAAAVLCAGAAAACAAGAWASPAETGLLSAGSLVTVLRGVALVVAALDAFLINVAVGSLLAMVTAARDKSHPGSRQRVEYSDSMQRIVVLMMGADAILIVFAAMLLFGACTERGRSTPLVYFALVYGFLPGLWVMYNMQCLARKLAPEAQDAKAAAAAAAGGLGGTLQLRGTLQHHHTRQVTKLNLPPLAANANALELASELLTPRTAPPGSAPSSPAAAAAAAAAAARGDNDGGDLPRVAAATTDVTDDTQGVFHGSNPSFAGQHGREMLRAATAEAAVSAPPSPLPSPRGAAAPAVVAAAAEAAAGTGAAAADDRGLDTQSSMPPWSAAGSDELALPLPQHQSPRSRLGSPRSSSAQSPGSPNRRPAAEDGDSTTDGGSASPPLSPPSPSAQQQQQQQRGPPRVVVSSPRSGVATALASPLQSPRASAAAAASASDGGAGAP